MKNSSFPALIFFTGILFFVLPLFYLPQLADVDSSSSVLAMAFVLVFTSGYFLFFYPQDNTEVPMFYRHPVYLLFAAFVLILGVSALFKSVNTGEAVFEWLRYVNVFCILSVMCSLANNKKFLPLLLKCLNLLLPLLYVIAFDQLRQIMTAAKHDHTDWTFDLTFAATFGNKNNFSQCLLLMLPFIAMSTYYLEKWWRGLAVINLLMSFGLILLLKTLSVFVAGMVTSAILLLLIIYRKRQHAGSRKLLIISGLFVAGIILFMVADPGKVVSSNSVAEKLSTSFGYLSGDKKSLPADNSNSIYERLLLWRNSFKMIRDFPATGVGFTNWKLFFPKYGYGGAVYMEGDNTKFTKAHNDFLETWSETGPLGFLLLVALFGYSIFCCLRILKDKYATDKDFYSRALPLVNIVTFPVIMIFDFPLSRSFQLLLLAATLAFVIGHSTAKRIVFPVKTMRIIVCFTIIVSIITMNAAVSRLKAEASLQKVIHWQVKKNWPKALAEAKKINSTYLPIDHAATPVEWYKGSALFFNNDIINATAEFEKAEQRAPYHTQVLNDLGTCYDKQGFTEKAKRCYEKVLSFNPKFPGTILNMTALLFNEGKTDEAYAMLRTCPPRFRSTNYRPFKTVILKTMARQEVDKVHLTDTSLTRLIANEKWLLKTEESADSLRMPFGDYLKKLLREN